MITIQGEYNTALCYTPELEETAKVQIQTLCNVEEFSDCMIRIMPDVHAGMGCTIGTTMTIKDKIVPGMIGVDIGCGMETVRIKERSLDLEKLDGIIYRSIPFGFNVRTKHHTLANEIDLSMLRCIKHINENRAYKSIGTLGGGNHFIEVDKNDNGELYIVVHSGSRYLGNQVAQYYQNEGYKSLCGNDQIQIDQIIAQLKAEGRETEIQSTIKELKKEININVPKELAYIEGSLFDDYIHDMEIIQRFAELNRKAMMDVIVKELSLSVEEEFTTIHNYIDTDSMILRKGSVSAKNGEKLLIPINMRDGSLICIGKGNPEWNYSAPHGAGRIMSRNVAYKQLSMEQDTKEMQGIYSSCISPSTLDESPMAYKPIEQIIDQISPTANIIEKIKPIYNFKADETPRSKRK